MRALLTSGGIKNDSIRDALVDLLGKPIAESNALFIPTAIYPFPGGPGMAWRALSGQASSPLCELGWKSLGILELSVLPSIDEDAWVPTVRDADALLVWGGDPLFLAQWMRRSGLTALLATLRSEAVYVGVSAGSIAAAGTFVETYVEPPRGNDGPLTSQDVVFTTPQGDCRPDPGHGTGSGARRLRGDPAPGEPGPPRRLPGQRAEVGGTHPCADLCDRRRRAPSWSSTAPPSVVSEGQWKLFQP